MKKRKLGATKPKKRSLAMAKLLCAADLPEETDVRLVKITVLGHRRALIENHKGVYAFTKEGVSLTGAEGVISVYGKELEIRRFDAGHIAVEGYITGVSYE